MVQVAAEAEALAGRGDGGGGVGGAAGSSTCVGGVRTERQVHVAVVL